MTRQLLSVGLTATIRGFESLGLAIFIPVELYNYKKKSKEDQTKSNILVI